MSRSHVYYVQLCFHVQKEDKGAKMKSNSIFPFLTLVRIILMEII